MISPDKIKDVIGKGGETITKIICEASNVKEVTNINAVKIEVEDSGQVIEDFGCFVEIWPGCEGLVHISQLAHERVEKVTDIVKLGDEIIVKAMGTDKKGRQDFSRKEALPKPKKNKDKETEK